MERSSSLAVSPAATASARSWSCSGRTGGCNNRKFVVVGRARLRPDGRFRVTAKPFPGLAIAIYRARTAIPGGRTFTLPQAVKPR